MGVIDEIKQKIDIVEVIGQYVQLTKSGRTFRAPCPFHSEKKPSFFVYPEQQTWHCFGACNTGGDVFSFIMKKEGLDFGDALRLLAEKTGVALPSRAKSEAEDKARDKILQINQAAAQYFHNLLLSSQAAENARHYLKGRGLNDKSITDFQLGYSLPGWESLKQYLLEKGFTESELFEAGLIIKSEETGKTHDRFRDHIMFPIMDERGRVTGFGARVLDPASEGPKYINSPQTRVFDKSGSLYGIHLAKSAIRQKRPGGAGRRLYGCYHRPSVWLRQCHRADGSSYYRETNQSDQEIDPQHCSGAGPGCRRRRSCHALCGL